MVMVFSIGLMEHIMKASGVLIKLKDKVLSGMRKEIFIEESLGMIWRMVMVNILILMGQNIMENLRMMFKKVMEKKNGLMVLNMSDPIKVV
jgi:hypothetical protein